MTPFDALGNKPFENIVGKGEITGIEQFLLFPQCFLSIWITFCHFRQIWNCHLQTLSVWKSLIFVVWQWVNYLANNKILRLVKIQSICTWQNKCEWKIEICFGMDRKHCGKRRKCWLPAFSQRVFKRLSTHVR